MTSRGVEASSACLMTSMSSASLAVSTYRPTGPPTRSVVNSARAGGAAGAPREPTARARASTGAGQSSESA